MGQNFDIYLKKLKNSKFRANFSLKASDFAYIQKKGIETIRLHAEEFVNKRIAPKVIVNDGKQTPMKGHPVFVAQHATATCCRGCLFKWYGIPQNKNLSEQEIDFVVNLIMAWIENEISNLN